MKKPSILRALAYLVPANERDEWLDTWSAELHYALNNGRSRFSLLLGATEDAAKITMENWRMRLHPTDLKYALRSTAKAPLLSIVVVATIGIAIGANTAVFALMDQVLLRPLPVHEPERLADIYTTCRRSGNPCTSSYQDYLDYRDQSSAFQDIAAFFTDNVSVGNANDRPEVLEVGFVTGNYFALLGVGAPIGRPIATTDDVLHQTAHVVVLSHRYWRQRFESDPTILGRRLVLNGRPFEVVGVAAEGFRGTRLADAPVMWVPFTAVTVFDSTIVQRLENRGARWVRGVIGRLRDDVTIEAARADMVALSTRLEQIDSGRAPRTIIVEPTGTATLPTRSADDITQFVILLMAVVGIVLVIASVNVAGLLVAKASSRRHEIGVRLALGAQRSRLVGQLMLESALLAGSGAVLGLFIGKAGISMLSAYSLPGRMAIADFGIGIDWRILAFTGLVTAVTTLFFGLVPAVQATKPQLDTVLVQERSTTGSHSLARLRGILLTTQTGLAVMLMVGAGLFLRSLGNGLAIDTGYDQDAAVVATMVPSRVGYDAAGTARLIEDVTQALESAPGIERAAAAVMGPFDPGGYGFFTAFEGYVPQPDERVRIETNFVTPGYFETMELPLLAGRPFEAGDVQTTMPVAIVNKTIVERYFNSESPVGRMMRFRGDDVTIVGVADDIARGLLDEQGPFVYLPIAQHSSFSMRYSNILASFVGSESAAIGAVTTALRQIDPRLSFDRIETLGSIRRELLMPQRLGAVLLTSLGGITLLLAVIGIFASVSYAIARMRREIGVRIALGATRAEVIQQTAAGAMRPVVLGALLGGAGALAASRLVQAFLYGIKPTDPVTLGFSIGGMLLVALGAALLPSLKAAAIDPMEALRTD